MTTDAAQSPISFARGAPSADLLPAELVREAAGRALESDWKAALSYGTGYGHPALREWAAERHGVPVERVMITDGSMQAAALLFEQLVSAGDAVAVESPSYDRTLLLLDQREADIRAIALEADGIDVGALADEADAIELAHVIPNFHNPAGCTLSAVKREKVVDLASSGDFLIFEDDPYADVRFEGEPLPTMLSLDESGERVIYASSFSKTVSPGVRVGYLVGPEELISRLAKRANELYISPNMLAESIVAEMTRSGGLEENVSTVVVELGRRCDALCSALREHLPEADFVQPKGGYFLWLTLPDDIDVASLQPLAAAEGVTFVKGSDFMLDGGGSALRLSFAPVPADQIEEGVRRLAAALSRLRAGAPA